MTVATRLGIATFGLRGGGSGGTDRIVGATDSIIAQTKVTAVVTADADINAQVASIPMQSVTVKSKNILTTSSTGSVNSTIKA